MLFQPMTHEVSQLEADLCSAFADPTRILILYALNRQRRNVTDLAHELRLNQPSVSRHLKVLRDHDLVRTTRCGVSIVYELADSRLIEALNILRTVLRDQISHKAHLVLERKE
jgi:DNA-binding transcriptional ArsR family regulator